MSIFFIGLYILFFATAIYYLIFFAFIYYWHTKTETYVIVPLIYTFWFFAVGFLLVCITSLSFEYAPEFINLIIK